MDQAEAEAGAARRDTAAFPILPAPRGAREARRAALAQLAHPPGEAARLAVGSTQVIALPLAGGNSHFARWSETGGDLGMTETDRSPSLTSASWLKGLARFEVMSARVSSQWGRMAASLLFLEARSVNQELLQEVGLKKPEEKLPALESGQLACLHENTRLKCNQYSRIRECRACKARVAYLPTALALEVVRAKAGRRRERTRLVTSRPEGRSTLQSQAGEWGPSSSAGEGLQRIEELNSLSAEGNITTQRMIEQLGRQNAEMVERMGAQAVQQTQAIDDLSHLLAHIEAAWLHMEESAGQSRVGRL